MNSNKYDFYKFANIYLIANAVIMLAGIVMLIVLGFNYNTTIAGPHLLLECVLAIVISLLIAFIYVGIRYGLATAFSTLFVTVHNILLSTALLVIIRTPISESILMGYLLLTGLSIIYTLILTEKIKDANLKKANYHNVIKDSIKSSAKPITILSIVLVVVLFLCLIVASENMLALVRILCVMLMVLIYSAFTISIPAWCYISSKIKKIKRVIVDENVENQKLVKAVTLQNGENVGSAKIEPDAQDK